MNTLEDDQKQYQETIQTLRERLSRLEENKPFQEWNEEDILKWIFSLNNGFFLKYEQRLKDEIMDAEMKGDDLLKLDRKALKNLFGIKKFAEQTTLIENIHALSATHADHNVPAPAYSPREGDHPGHVQGNVHITHPGAL